jgi:hypothetical protein
MSGFRRRDFGVIAGGAGRADQQPTATLPGAGTIDPDAALPHQYDDALLLVGGRSTGPGDMERCDFKIHENYLAWARRLIDSGRFPNLQSKSDVARLGFVIACRWLDSLAPEEVERSIMHQIGQMEEVMAWEQRQLRYVKFIDAVSKMITEQLALPHGKLQAARVLRKMRRHISRMEPSFYKTHFEKMFGDRFGAFERAGLLMLDAHGEGGSAGGVGGTEFEDQSEAAFWESDDAGAALIEELSAAGPVH